MNTFEYFIGWFESNLLNFGYITLSVSDTSAGSNVQCDKEARVVFISRRTLSRKLSVRERETVVHVCVCAYTVVAKPRFQRNG